MKTKIALGFIFLLILFLPKPHAESFETSTEKLGTVSNVQPRAIGFGLPVSFVKYYTQSSNQVISSYFGLNQESVENYCKTNKLEKECSIKAGEIRLVSIQNLIFALIFAPLAVAALFSAVKLIQHFLKNR